MTPTERAAAEIVYLVKDDPTVLKSHGALGQARVP
jgi:hypothetical protein